MRVACSDAARSDAALSDAVAAITLLSDDALQQLKLAKVHGSKQKEN